MTNPDNQKGMEVFNGFPHIQALGQAEIQRLCDEWIKNPVPKECGVARVEVGDEASGYALNPQIAFTHAVQPGEAVHFPLDNLLFFLIDHAVPEEQRENYRQLVRLKRAQAPMAFQRFKTNLPPRKPLFLRCKNPKCADLMMTQFEVLPGQKVLGTFDPITCVRCGKTHQYFPGDLFQLP